MQNIRKPVPRESSLVSRTTNFTERLFGEGRRRTKVIPQFPDEKSCLKIVYAALITVSERWHGIKVTPAMMKQLDTMKKQLFEKIPDVKRLAA